MSIQPRGGINSLSTVGPLGDPLKIRCRTPKPTPPKSLQICCSVMFLLRLTMAELVSWNRTLPSSMTLTTWLYVANPLNQQATLRVWALKLTSHCWESHTHLTIHADEQHGWKRFPRKHFWFNYVTRVTSLSPSIKRKKNREDPGRQVISQCSPKRADSFTGHHCHCRVLSETCSV